MGLDLGKVLDHEIVLEFQADLPPPAHKDGWKRSIVGATLRPWSALRAKEAAI